MRRVLTLLGTASKPTVAVVSLALLGLGLGGAYVALAGTKTAKPTITSGPANPTSSTAAAFAYTSKTAGSFLCSLDGGAFVACGSGTSGSKSYAGPLAQGPHIFRVEAQSGSSTSDPAAWTWTIDTTPPPAPTVGAHPADPTDSTSARFTFSDTETGVAFACSLDGGAFQPCSSGITYGGLGAGGHTFRVEAIDKAGNTGPATTFGWTIVPPPPPKPAITSGPVSPTNQTGATFTYTDSAAVSFLCSLDSGAFAACGSGTSGSTSYSGPLADGPHTFRVEATTGGSQPSGSAARTWTIDTLAPPAPTFTKTPANPTNDTKAKFEYADSEHGVSFQCKLDGGAYAACGAKTSYTGLALGSHTFCVRALDKAGNASAPTCFTWQIGAAPASFGIAGSPLAGVLLYPGGPNVPINLVFTNPNASPITVQSVTVTVTRTTAPGCGAGAFSVVQQLSATPTVPASSTRSLQDLGVPQSSWPQLRMADSGNQDACQHASVNLSYSGTANG